MRPSVVEPQTEWLPLGGRPCRLASSGELRLGRLLDAPTTYGQEMHILELVEPSEIELYY